MYYSVAAFLGTIIDIIHSAQIRRLTYRLAYYKHFDTSYLTVGCVPCTSASCPTSISMASWRLTHCVRNCNSSEKRTEFSYTLTRLFADFVYFRYFLLSVLSVHGWQKDGYLFFKEWSSCTSYTQRTARCKVRTEF